VGFAAPSRWLSSEVRSDVSRRFDRGPRQHLIGCILDRTVDAIVRVGFHRKLPGGLGAVLTVRDRGRGRRIGKSS